MIIIIIVLWFEIVCFYKGPRDPTDSCTKQGIFQGYTYVSIHRLEDRLEKHILNTQEWKPRTGKDNGIVNGRWRGKYQVKQERDLALTCHDTVPSTPLHLRSKRTPESSRVLLYPGGEGIAVFDKHQTSIIILILVQWTGVRVFYLMSLRWSKSGTKHLFPKRQVKKLS